jgi:hypothetical protein
MGGQRTKSLVLAIGLMALCGTPALAFARPDDSHLGSPLRYPGAPKPLNDDPKSPYAMNYADEAAQTLGVRDGHLDVFSSQPAENNPFVPVLSGGLGGDGAMLRLQWHPGG